MATLDHFPNGIPTPEPPEYRCHVCDSPINPESRMLDSYGWAHYTCSDEFMDPSLRNERP